MTFVLGLSLAIGAVSLYATTFASTTVDAATAAGVQTVTPESMSGIEVGTNLLMDGFRNPGAGEWIAVTAVTSTTFTATFAHPHAAFSNLTNDPKRVPYAAMWGT